MRNMFTRAVCITVIGVFAGLLTASAQDKRPELMYFRFDEPGQLVTPNRANPATMVVPEATLAGALSMGDVGQFGSALVASGGGSGDIVNTGWTTNLGNTEWTISFWINQVNGSTFGYYFGDPSAGSFRCFNAGAAGTNNLLFRGPFTDVQVTGVAPGPTVIHFVRELSPSVIKAYKNGVLVNTVSQSATLSINGSGGQFGIGAYSGGGGSGSFPGGALMDEFRIYSRAMTAQEIADTWDDDVDCFIPDGQIGWEITDASGTPSPVANAPGMFYLKYFVNYPAGETPVNITVNLYNVQGGGLVHTESISDTKPDGANLNGIQPISIPGSVQPGIYRVEAIFNTTNSCDQLADYPAGETALFVLEPGQSLCLVWPGDVTNDGIVNYGDRKSLASYIHEANLRDDWLNGPARYRVDAVTNPLTYLKWEAQPSVPWKTPNGCYMDTDGNGVINNFDFIAIKMNWFRVHGSSSTGKDKDGFAPQSFSMSQNFPNPFNPSTSINFSVPERSYVKIAVFDMLGREVVSLIDDEVDAGIRTLQFDASGLQSGNYVATAVMQGTESGSNYSKTIQMTLSK